MSFSVSVAQLDFVVGDMAGNARRIVEAATAAHSRGVRLLLTPELAICGYAAEDLYLRPAFIDACDDALKSVAASTAHLKGLHIVVGHPARTGKGARGRSVAVASLHNAASVLCEGRVIATYAKRELPNYQVFDERRYFVPGQGACVFDVPGAEGQPVRVGLLICEDAWFDAPAADARAAGAEVLAVINASPFHAGKGGEREATMRERVRATGLPLVYAHLVGGQDEIVFEGRSFVLDSAGELVGRARSFEEAEFDARFERAGGAWRIEASIDREHSAEADLWHALVLGVRDYVGKNGFPGAILGLSGGIDSALVLAIAVDALGKDRVRAVMMPSPYTADISWIDARDMAARLGVRYDEMAIAPEFEAFKASLAPLFEGRAEDTTEENLQARIRGTLLMALSNKFGWRSATPRSTATWRAASPSSRTWPRPRCSSSRAGATRTTPTAPVPSPSPSASSRARPARSCAPTRPTRTASPHTPCSMPSSSATWRTTRAPRPSSPRASRAPTSRRWCA